MLIEYCKKEKKKKEEMVFPFKCKDFDLLARREGDTDHQFIEVKTITHRWSEKNKRKK